MSDTDARDNPLSTANVKMPVSDFDGVVVDRNPWLWTVLGSMLGLVLLYASTRKVDATTLLAALKAISPGWALGVLLCTLAFNAIKAWRWRLLLRFAPISGFAKIHAAVYAGLAANFLIAHVGEFLRAVMVARGHRVAVSAVFATIVVERALDFVAFLALLAVLPLIAAELPQYFELAAILTGGIVVLAGTTLYLVAHTPAWLHAAAAVASRVLPTRLADWIRVQIDKSREGLTAISDARLMLAAILLSVVQWALVAAAIWASAAAVGASVTVVASIATLLLIVVGLTLPNSPMQIGTTQLAFTLGLGIAGVTADAAVAASLVYTMFLIIPVMLIGGVCLLQNRSWQWIRLR